MKFFDAQRYYGQDIYAIVKRDGTTIDCIGRLVPFAGASTTNAAGKLVHRVAIEPLTDAPDGREHAENGPGVVDVDDIVTMDRLAP